SPNVRQLVAVPQNCQNHEINSAGFLAFLTSTACFLHEQHRIPYKERAAQIPAEPHWPRLAAGFGAVLRDQNRDRASSDHGQDNSPQLETTSNKRRIAAGRRWTNI